MKESDDVVEKFKALRGQDALDAQQSVRQQLDQIHDHYGSGLAPVDKLKFDNSYRSYQYRYLNGQITTHATSQGYQFASKTNADAEQHANQIAATNYNNPEIVDQQVHAARDAAMKQLQVDGMARDPNAVQEALRRADLGVYKAAAEAMYVHDPMGAAKYVEDHRKELGAAYAPLADQFRTRNETVTAETRAEVLQKINGTADPIVKKGIADANRKVLGDEIYKSLFPEEGAAPKSNVVPIKPQAETPPEQAKRLLEEEKKKVPGQPAPGAAPAKDELGRVGGQGASIDIPFHPMMATAEGRAQLIENGLKTYQPGTTLVSTFGKFTVPQAGTSFQYEGKTYTVPIAKPPAAAAAAAAPPTAAPAPAPAATAPVAPAAAPAATAPQKQSQNFTPAQNQKTGQALPFGEEQTKNYSPAQTAIARAIDSRTEKDLNVRQLPGQVLEKARDVALYGGPGELKHFMAENGYPKAGNWCGEFAAAVVRNAGGTPPKNPEIASNWRGWGQPTTEPKAGDIAVRRGTPTGQTGSHVTFVENFNPQAGTFTAIGGNQGHARSTFRIADFDFRTGMPEREARQ